ncbi:hypothetical protein WKI68_19520 [Streptomyces sp. MS1.HAVA.3]|uniref:Uncharacterized protein n=1 Tax=Streptomyces caledonius TaxID=3134107 RepID=A0ABU8U758_9ACTN
MLGLGWTASGALLLCGLVLLARCVRTVHGRSDRDGDPDAGAEAGPHRDAGADSAGTGTAG